MVSTTEKDGIIRFEGSIGEFVPAACPTCKQRGEFHEILVCRICTWPPLRGRCICDQGKGRPKQEAVVSATAWVN